jgi:phosphoribosylcarboxyaminoimidazole (NCAIR) mutase
MKKKSREASGNTQARVAIIMGSDSDYSVMKEAALFLKK